MTWDTLIYLEHKNQFADALATLASSVDIPIDVVIRQYWLSRGLHPPIVVWLER